MYFFSVATLLPDFTKQLKTNQIYYCYLLNKLISLFPYSKLSKTNIKNKIMFIKTFSVTNN